LYVRVFYRSSNKKGDFVTEIAFMLKQYGGGAGIIVIVYKNTIQIYISRGGCIQGDTLSDYLNNALAAIHKSYTFGQTIHELYTPRS